MGNIFGMMKQQAVHPWGKIPAASGGGVRMRVRMTTAELKELMAAVDLSEGSSDLGRLILRELSKGRYQARVLACDDLIMPVKKLSFISEEKEEEEDDDKLL